MPPKTALVPQKQTPGGLLQRYAHMNWALADQALVSGSNFVASILLARFLGLELFGQFVLIYSILLYANTIQVTMIISPMMSLAPQVRNQKARDEFLRGAFAVQAFFSGTLIIVIMLLGLLMIAVRPSYISYDIIVSFSLAAALFQMQDWLRRFFFVNSAGMKAFVNDLISYLGQVLVLLLLYHFSKLNVPNAFLAIAGTSTAACVFGVLTEKLTPLWRYAPRVFWQSWAMGRDLLLSGQLQWAGSQGVVLIGAALLGVSVAGGIRAAQNLIGPLQLLFQAMENFIPARAAKHYAEEGLEGLAQYLRKISTWGGTALIVPCLLVTALAGRLLVLTYGQPYTAYSSLVGWSALFMFISFFYQLASYYHRTTGTTSTLLPAMAISSAVGLVLAFVLASSLQAVGVMLSIITGRMIGTIFVIYRALLHRRQYFTSHHSQ